MFNRPVPPPPAQPLTNRGSISFCHPGHTQYNIFLRLARVDQDPDSSLFGVHHETALLACRIIACNNTDGYLADKDHNRVQTPVGGILVENKYFLQIDGQGKVSLLS